MMFNVIKFTAINPDRMISDVVASWSTLEKALMSRDIFESTTSTYPGLVADPTGKLCLWPQFGVVEA